MSSDQLWKWAVILGAVGLAAWLVYPPEETINLGLDLSGGVHILMEVATATAVEFERNQAQSRIGQALTDEGIAYEAVRKVDVDTLELQGADATRTAEVRQILDNLIDGWTMTELTGGTWRATMPPPLRAAVERHAVEQTLETLRKRVDGLGLKEPLIRTEGVQQDRILIQLPGVEDIISVQEFLGEPALLEWKEVSFPPGVDPNSFRGLASRESIVAQFGGQLPADTEIFEEMVEGAEGEVVGVAYWPLKTVSVVIGSDLKSARRSTDQWGLPAVSFELTQEAAKRFLEATRRNRGRPMAILLDKRVISAPTIESEIFDQGQITRRGGFPLDEAEKLSLQLRSGALPVDIRVLEERTVGPSLGQDSIKAGLSAISVGFVGVLVFMLLYYRLSGVNAVIALALNILLVLGAMAYFGATLTLPGIAGLVLVVGMAVDANVLIFERIREELALGKTVRSAVDQGFRRAFMTIIDCNITTLFAAVFLFAYGTGPVKGFAVTLMIGLLASMFTAIFVSYQIFILVLRRKKRVESLSI